MALVRERTILTKRPSLVGEVSANFCGLESAGSTQDIDMKFAIKNTSEKQ
jgi:hypothetical protein